VLLLVVLLCCRFYTVAGLSAVVDVHFLFLVFPPSVLTFLICFGVIAAVINFPTFAYIPLFMMFLGSLLLLSILLLPTFLLLRPAPTVSAVAGGVLLLLMFLVFLFYPHFIVPQLFLVSC
jgi:hypothetical protein